MRGEMEVTLNKEELLAKLRENREGHRAAFESALEGYKEAARDELERKLRHLSEGREIDRWIKNQPPEDHTSDYDNTIDMLSMSVGEEIVLTESQFRQYVKDDWGWKEAWVASNSAYMS